MTSFEQRLWAKVSKSGPVFNGHPCWVWSGHTDKGYGRMRINGRMTVVHRVAYELLVGPIPKGLVLDHLCRNPPCVNPDHLEPVTNCENIRRGISPAGIAAQKTHCDRCGSELVQINHRQRGCAPCTRKTRRENMRRYAAEGRPYTQGSHRKRPAEVQA